jgi:hypothetical protein
VQFLLAENETVRHPKSGKKKKFDFKPSS